MANEHLQPGWWTNDRHEGAWARVKDALHRDWEQTKADFGGNAPDLDQDVDDTVKQAVGKNVIPPGNQPNVPGGMPKMTVRTWADAESSVRYGVGAREQYGTAHPAWNDKLEGTLKSEWDGFGAKTKSKWDEVKRDVRRGYERAKG